jgi:hypothetical protein
LNPRLAAGVGVLAAFLVLGGPAAAAIADPGGSNSGGSSQSSSSDRGGTQSRGGSKNADNRGSGRGNGNGDNNGSARRGGDNDRNGSGNNSSRRGNGNNGNGNGNNGSGNNGSGNNGNGSGNNGNGHNSGGNNSGGNGNGNSGGNGNGNSGGGVSQGGGNPPVRVGSGRNDAISVTPDNAGAPGGGPETGSDSAGPGLGITTVPQNGSGSDPGVPPVSAQPPTADAGPPVTVGNGRFPAILSGGYEPQLASPDAGMVAVPLPAPDESPAPPAPRSWSDRLSEPPGMSKQLGISASTDLHGPLWGIAGLLLIPAAGAALGYRQARATQSAERLRRTRAPAQVLAEDLP